MGCRSLLAVIIGVLSVAACGRMLEGGNAGDAAPVEDAAPDVFVACGDSAFGAASAIAELDTPDDEKALRFTSNELTAVFWRGDNEDAFDEYLRSHVFLATRSSRTAPFASPLRLDILQLQQSMPHGGCAYPNITDDKQKIYYETFCSVGTPPDNAALPLCRSTRVDGGAFSIGLAALWLGANEPGPFGMGEAYGDGFVTSDAGAYYFLGPDDGGADAGYRMLVGHHPISDAAPYAATFDGIEPLVVPHDPATIVDNPVVTSDELTIFVSTRSAADPVQHIAFATRATTSDPFGPLTQLHELDSAEGEYPSWISVDRCRLYMTRKVGGQWDLYVASRAP